MQLVSLAGLSVEHGLIGDCRGKPGPRQVTLLSAAAWRAACEELDVELAWTERRANLLVNDLPLFESTGARISIGAALLVVTGETDPCQHMEAAHPGLFGALAVNWRGGVCCRVLRGGEIFAGMDVGLDSPPK